MRLLRLSLLFSSLVGCLAVIDRKAVVSRHAIEIGAENVKELRPLDTLSLGRYFVM